MLTYGDVLANVDLNKLINFHKKHKKCVTLTTISVANQKGVLELSKNGAIASFREKNEKDNAIINGGFMVCESNLMDYIDNDKISLEKEPMEKLAKKGELMGYYHDGFWQCMDTQREMKLLNDLWDKNKAPWKIWK